MVTNKFYNKRIRFHILWGLVFSFLLYGCQQKKQEDRKVTVGIKENRPVAIMIPRELLKGLPDESIKQFLKINLHGNTVPIIGEIILNDDDVVFEPLIAFTRGLTYDIWLKGDLLTEIAIAPGEYGNGVLLFYPSADTVPQNLLKFYLAFSKPMQEGNALENILLIRNEKDTIRDAFLDLQPELWNKEGTVLTLWFDPGRIKRGLQPNERSGTPLEKGNNYRLIVSPEWRDTEGNKIGTEYHHGFVTNSVDTSSPDIQQWILDIPKADMQEALIIHLNESLDHYLLKKMVWITDDVGKPVDGTIETKENETILVFTPSEKWNAANYILEIDAKLEDLAGNNLNRLFDKDLTKKANIIQKDIYKRAFTIR